MNLTKEKNILTLYELNLLIQNTFQQHFGNKYYWIKAEIHKLNIYKYSGHAYPELLEKKEDTILCQMKGIIWKNDLIKINEKFLSVTGEPLKENVTALMLVNIKYDAKYGLSIQIKDIDPSFALGELEKQKRQTIDKLKKENIFELNKSKKLPIVPQNIAVISVETSKGYNDLITTFKKYEHLFQINIKLFPSLLQGESAAYQIQNQLQNITHQTQHFDAVLIIRGGGGEVGLSCYNDYELCKAIALFPIPVITGIGHSTNFTVAEMVAFQNGITPTDTAMIIIQQFEKFHSKIIDIQHKISTIVQNTIQAQTYKLNNFKDNIIILSQNIFHQQHTALNSFYSFLKNNTYLKLNQQNTRLFKNTSKLKHLTYTYTIKEHSKIENIKQKTSHAIKKHIFEEKNKIQYTQTNLITHLQKYLQANQQKINTLEKHLHILNPKNTLKRGYCIVYDHQNKIIKTTQSIKENQEIKIQSFDSEIKGQLINIKTIKYDE